jgi:hypothetical protein
MDPARGDLALNLPSQILAFVSQSQQTVEIPLCHHQVDGFAGALCPRMSPGGLGFGALHLWLRGQIGVPSLAGGPVSAHRRKLPTVCDLTIAWKLLRP